MASILSRTIREASLSLTLGVFLGAAATSGAMCGVAAFSVANEKFLARLGGRMKLLVQSAVETTRAVRGAGTRGAVRHVVMFSFKPNAPVIDIVNAFDALVVSLGESVVQEYERGTQCSPEGLDKGMTHVFTLTFASIEARDAYLPHPLHAAFVAKWVKPFVADVLVSDYVAVQSG